MQWFYLDQNKEQKTFDEASLSELMQSKEISSETLVWAESLSDWSPAATAFPTQFANATLPEIADPIPAFSSSSPTNQTLATAPTADKPSLVTLPSSQDIEHVASSETIKDLASYLAASAKWMKLLGVMSLISGILVCLSIVGAIVGWLPIWIGLILMKAANAARHAEMTGDQSALAESLDRLRLGFKIYGILTLINLVIMVAYFAIFGAAMIAGIIGATSAASSGTP